MNLTINNSAPKTPNFGTLVSKDLSNLPKKAQKLTEEVLQSDCFQRVTGSRNIELISILPKKQGPKSTVSILGFIRFVVKGDSPIDIGISNHNIANPGEFENFCCNVLKYRLELLDMQKKAN